MLEHGQSGSKRTIKVKGTVTSLKQLIKETRLSLVKPHVIPPSGAQACAPVVHGCVYKWASRGDGISRAGYTTEWLFRGGQTLLHLEDGLGFLQGYVCVL